MNFKALVLTDFTVKVQHGCREKAVRKAVEDSDLVKKWEATAWAKKLARRKRRRALSDFDRYKVKVLKQKVTYTAFPCKDNIGYIASVFLSFVLQKSKLVRTTYNKLKKEQKV